ncbi:hypothetical protein AB0O67_06160 [Streptomyces sp. NPDC086077]|uniref:hypothetical protein n=1 Tax=Streptomyces sp. NPDC086077 TaxID=3154862 RepID=UPI00344AD91A
MRAAQRELREETGWADLGIDGTLLCLWEHDFTRAGVPVRRNEHVYLAHGPRRDPVPRSRRAADPDRPRLCLGFVRNDPETGG